MFLLYSGLIPREQKPAIDDCEQLTFCSDAACSPAQVEQAVPPPCTEPHTLPSVESQVGAAGTLQKDCSSARPFEPKQLKPMERYFDCKHSSQVFSPCERSGPHSEVSLVVHVSSAAPVEARPSATSAAMRFAMAACFAVAAGQQVL